MASERSLRVRARSFATFPPYSPDFSPIEMTWSKVKSIINAVGPRSMGMLDRVLARAIGAVTKSDCEAWFAHCGYRATCST